MNAHLQDNGAEQKPTPDRIAYLVAGFLQQKLTEKEHNELDEWICTSNDNLRMFERLTDPQTLERDLRERSVIDSGDAYRRLLHQLPAGTEQKMPVYSLWKYIAAAVLIIIAGSATYFLLYRNQADPTLVAQHYHTLQPGNEKALLVLANGRTIALNNTISGLLEKESGNEIISNRSGEIIYKPFPTGATDTGFNTLSVPVGGRYSVTLPDGSKVWLNSGSSIRYALQNTVKTRVVELTGEAYFEVTSVRSEKSREKVPFIVKANDLEIKVLGTRFNVSAYADEESTRATLLEGSVEVTYPIKKRSALLYPGQQAELTRSADIMIKENVPVQEIIAWKNGLFEFRNQPIETIMRQVARWYDAKIVYEGKIDFHFNATIDRKEPVNKLLELLEMTNRVHFRTQDKTIYVTP